LKEFYEQQLMESQVRYQLDPEPLALQPQTPNVQWQVQYQLNLRIEMDALKSQVRHNSSNPKPPASKL